VAASSPTPRAEKASAVSSPLAVELRHLAGVVAVAGHRFGRDGRLDRGQRVGFQLGLPGDKGLGQPLPGAGTDQRHDVIAAGEHPGDRGLRHGDTGVVGYAAEGVDEREVHLEVGAGEPWAVDAEVVDTAAVRSSDR